jgi:hypothetical protein
VDPVVLPSYKWEKRENLTKSFVDYLCLNDNTKNSLSSHQYFHRSKSQEKIKKIELVTVKTYPDTLMDLTNDHLPLLRLLKN